MSSKENGKTKIENIIVRVREAASILNLEDWMVNKLTTCKMEWAGSIQFRKDDGQLVEVPANRIWYRNPQNGLPYKGGQRFHPDADSATMKPHAMEMGFKNWLVGIPFGGSKGGLQEDPAKLSLNEQKNLMEAWVDAVNELSILGPFRDVPAPDVGSNETMMNWIRQRYAQLRRSREDARFAGVVTGKPVGYGMGGIEGRREATGYGMLAVLHHAMKSLGIQIDHPRIAVMGFGNVGSHAVARATQFGDVVVAVSDVNGGVYNAKGLDVARLFEYFATAKTVKGFPGGDAISNDQIITLPDIDVFAPSAMEHVLTAKNAGQVNAKIILEGANSPTLAEADKILSNRGIIVLPDILANVGGVTVSYFEWARNVSHRDDDRIPLRGNRQDVLLAMENILTDTTDQVIANAKKYNVNLRMGALITSIQRITPAFRAKYGAYAI